MTILSQEKNEISLHVLFQRKVPRISVRYKIFRFILKRSGIKKILALPTKELLQKAQKINEKRCFKIPKDERHSYEDIVFLNQFHCLKIESTEGKVQKAVLFFYGGGMILGPDRSDIKFALIPFCPESKKACEEIIEFLK